MNDPAPTRAARPGLAVAALALGGLMTALTQTLVIPIQSELPRLLDADAADTAWVVTVTLLAAAVTMVLAGRIADLVGKKPVLLASAGILAVASVIVALSDSLVPVLVGRALQGTAMGFIPVGIALVREIVPPKMAATAVATISATLGVGGAIGLPLSAWIVEVGDWHTLFWVSTVAALVVLALVAAVVPHTHHGQGEKGALDPVGALLLAVGLVAFLVGVSKATDWGWGDARTLGAMIGGVVVLVGWGAWELRHHDPLVDLRATARRPVLLTNLAAIAIGFGMMAQSIVVPQLLQLPEATGYGLGQSILAAGLWMAPGGLMMLVFAPVSSRLMGTVGARTTLAIGAGVLSVGYLVATLLTGAPWQLMIAALICSSGVGIGYAAMPTIIMDNTEPREAGAAVGLNALTRSVGTTLAAAVMGTVLAGNTTELAPGVALPSEGAFTACFLIGAAAAVVGVLLVLGVPRRPTRPDAVQAAEAQDELVAG
ncbi:MFS transporter [Nocardioides bruguierae]|uniref:MFS transporter n=1 Tax=Nocardioides bruguierae TaxID=2945102 RepID=UPI0020224866|nr:MFS transporter [Nocardioides bruguierae]MCL8025369.1 MFS transporter [Nocardioides bruguierae]